MSFRDSMIECKPCNLQTMSPWDHFHHRHWCLFLRNAYNIWLYTKLPILSGQYYDDIVINDQALVDDRKMKDLPISLNETPLRL